MTGISMLQILRWAVIAVLILNSACAHVSPQTLACDDSIAYETLLAPVARGARTVTLQQLASRFENGSASCAQTSFTRRIHDIEKGCLCCVTIDVKGVGDPCSYTVQAIYVFYSALSRDQVDRVMRNLQAMLRPPSGTLVDSLQVRADEVVHTYNAGNAQYEFTIAIYRHHGFWTGSLTVVSYDLP